MKYLKQNLIRVMFLVGIDQVIKIIIWKFYFSDRVTIIKGVFKFTPKINKKLSWGGNYIDILSNPYITIILNVTIIIFCITAYNYKIKSFPIK